MTKKKILVLALTIAMVAILAVGGSLAYLTDTDAKTNVFTVGKVDITLEENFDEQNAKLLPGSQTSNAVQKEVWIELERTSEDAYVWYEWLIPAELDSTDSSTGTNNIIHVNSYGYTWDKYRESFALDTGALPEDKTWDHSPEGKLKALGVKFEEDGPEGFIGTETINNVVYNKYIVLYHGILSNDTDDTKKTTPAMKQVYMDSKVDTNKDGKYTINNTVIDYDFTNGLNIIVRAYAIQADGFADEYAACAAYYNK